MSVSQIALLSLMLVAGGSALAQHGLSKVEEQGHRAAEKIEVFMDTITRVQQFELALTLTAFPIDKEFVAIFEDLRKLGVNEEAADDLRENTFTKVRKVQSLIYKNSEQLSMSVHLLARMASDARSEVESAPEWLYSDMEFIEETVPKLIEKEIFHTLESIGTLHETFVEGIDDLTYGLFQRPRLIESDVIFLNDIKKRVQAQAQAYEDKLDQFEKMLLRVGTDYHNMLEETYTYFDMLNFDMKAKKHA